MNSKVMTQVAFGILLAGALAFPARSEPITYGFDDGTLQGWTTVSSDPGNSPDPERYVSAKPDTAQEGTMAAYCNNFNRRDDAHKPLWIRSPEFVINQSGNLTLWLLGGAGLAGYPGTTGTLPTHESQIPLGVDSTLSGVMGVALRDVATGDFVLTGQRSTSAGGTNWIQIAWDVSAYLNDGKRYTVELFDYHSGNGYSQLAMDSVSIPGTLIPAAFVDITNVTGLLSVVGVTDYTLEGTNNSYTVGNLWWTNTLNGASGTTTASESGWSFSVPISTGANLITLFGTNTSGSVVYDSVVIAKVQPPVITNEAPTNVGVSFAKACGYLTKTNYAPSQVILYYGMTDGGTDPNQWSTAVDLGIRPEGALAYLITNMTGVVYYRYCATNIAGLAWCPVTTAITPATPFDPTGYRMYVTIDFTGYTGTETLFNFPALVKLGTHITGFSYSDLRSGSNDVRIVDPKGLELSYEIDTWNTEGTSLLWVKIPLFTAGTQLKVYYSKAGVEAPAYRTDGSTWSEGYVATWHMKNKWLTDASGNGNDAEEVREWSPITPVAGQIGDALSFPLNDGVGGGTIITKNIKLTRQTLSAWVWSADLNDRWSTIMGKGDMWFMANVGTTYRFETAPFGNDYQPQIPSAGAWHYVVVTASGDGAYEGRYQAIYVDGELKGTWTKSAIPEQNGERIRIGAWWQWDRAFKGNLDELRMSNTPRSADWIKAEYDNQSSPATFATYSAADSVAPRGTVILFF